MDRDGDAPSTGRSILHVVIGLVATVGVAFGVQGMVAPEPVTLPPASQSADLRLEASTLIEQIEAYRAERGELPDPSLLTPYLDEGYAYHVVDQEAGRYVVQRTAAGMTVTYDGSLPVGLWVVIGGSSTGGSS